MSTIAPGGGAASAAQNSNTATRQKIYEKQTAASKAKQVGSVSNPTGNIDEKAMQNRHNPGWFARPEKFTHDRPSTNSQTRGVSNQQRGMSSSHTEGQGQGHRSPIGYATTPAAVNQDSASHLHIYEDGTPSGGVSSPGGLTLLNADALHQIQANYGSQQQLPEDHSSGFLSMPLDSASQ